MASNRRVVVTGIGLVSSLGIGTEANWTALSAGTSGVSSTATRIGESAKPREATNHAIFRRFTAVSTRDFQIR